jgi:hypothetical protein
MDRQALEKVPRHRPELLDTNWKELIDVGQEQLRDDLEAILREPGAERALHLFVRAGYDRDWLEYCVTNPVAPDKRRDDAAARTIDRNFFKSTVNILEKVERLALPFREKTGERLIDGAELSRAIRLARLWVERPSLPFTARELQQLRLLEQIPRRPGRDGVLRPMPRLLRQAEILIDAIYTYRGIPDPHPDVRSLTDLIDRFDTIRRR